MFPFNGNIVSGIVTLHVSVWVEMHCLFLSLELIHVTLHVSVWVEICKWLHGVLFSNVTLHVSVWVEITILFPKTGLATSRSTWACELKFEMKDTEEEETEVTLHVSVWVEILVIRTSCKTAVVTLHVSVWVEILTHIDNSLRFASHAPRERVSWNVTLDNEVIENSVTLHVSVWVEIDHWSVSTNHSQVTLHVSVWVEIFTIFVLSVAFSSRSTWACELKFQPSVLQCMQCWSRSTWACELKFQIFKIFR